ncbi:hypothetical protein ACRQ4C_02710 [Curtobacterium sp. SP.BCp]|uniref:hypothetical protein n=1 Tax=Curtobacterium sp. SP.BCp TaxID=3435230 RepID=UPI003F73A710
MVRTTTAERDATSAADAVLDALRDDPVIASVKDRAALVAGAVAVASSTRDVRDMWRAGHVRALRSGSAVADRGRRPRGA